MGVKLVSSSGGSVEINPPTTASNFIATMPAGTGVVSVNGASSNIVSGTAVASTSGTSIDFTGIPSWAKRITVMLSGVSTNGTSNLIVQLGDSGGIENTGYTSTGGSASTGASPSFTTSTAGFLLNDGMVAARVNNGVATIVLLDSATNLWALTFFGNQQTFNTSQTGSGTKATSATLDRVRITTVNGTDTFDAGTINILYE
jgi:hypothetical protein